MANKTSKQEAKRLSKGQRTYIRRLKQAARKGTVPNSPHSTPAQPIRAPKKKQDQS